MVTHFCPHGHEVKAGQEFCRRDNARVIRESSEPVEPVESVQPVQIDEPSIPMSEETTKAEAVESPKDESVKDAEVPAEPVAEPAVEPEGEKAEGEVVAPAESSDPVAEPAP